MESLGPASITLVLAIEIMKSHQMEFSYMLATSVLDPVQLVSGAKELIAPELYNLRAYPLPDFSQSCVSLHGLAYRPFVDMLDLSNGQTRPIWPGAAPFAICLTHDVDSVSANSTRQHLRRLQTAWQHWRVDGDPYARRTIGLRTYQTLSSILKRGEPLFCYEKWLTLEAQYGTRSTFFFLPEHTRKPHWTDGGYTYDDRVIFDKCSISVREMMTEIIHRGWDVGLHASWNTYDDVDEMKYQKEQVERAIGCDIVSVRQHYLHHDPWITPVVQAEAGFQYDLSVGFNSNVGFRRGTCWLRPLQNLHTGDMLPISELPLIYQDGSILANFKGLGLVTAEAKRCADQLMLEVEKVAGIFTALWHPNNIISHHYMNVYEHILAHGRTVGAFMGSVDSITKAWRQN